MIAFAKFNKILHVIEPYYIMVIVFVGIIGNTFSMVKFLSPKLKFATFETFFNLFKI